MESERKRLRALLPGRTFSGIAGAVLLFLALELGLISWFLQARLSPLPEALDADSRSGSPVYFNAVSLSSSFAGDDQNMSYHFAYDLQGRLTVVRFSAKQYEAAAGAILREGSVKLEGQARIYSRSLRELVMQSFPILSEDNLNDYLTPCFLDCAGVYIFLPALFTAVSACLFCLAGCWLLIRHLLNLRRRSRCLDRLEKQGLLQEACRQLGSTEGRLEFFPDIVVTADFLAVTGPGLVCALRDVKATRAGRRFSLILGDDSRLPLQRGPLSRLDLRLLELLCVRFGAES